jgi:hypothetical protein
MNIPASALAWEIGRKNRWGFLVVLASLLCGLVVRLSGATEDDVVQSVAGIAMMVSFLVTFAISTYADSGAQIAFPTRTFALPVRTGLLVNGVVFFGALAITVIHLAWAYLFLLPLDTHYPLGSFMIYWVAALVTFQAIVWNLAEHPKSFVVVLLIMMTLYVRLAALLAGNHGIPWMNALLLALFSAAYLTARVGIQRQRCGRWRMLARAVAWAEKTAATCFRRKRPFATAARAQLWMEWRQNAVTPSIGLGVVSVLMCAGLVRLAAIDGAGAFAPAALYVAGAQLTVWAIISGLLLSRDPCSRSVCLSSFLATRPMTSGALAFAKIELALRMTLLGWLFFAAGLAVWFAAFGWPPDPRLARQDGALYPTAGFVALALGWHLVGALPVWLTGRIGSPAWAGLLALAGYIALGQVLHFLAKHFDLFVILPWIFGFLFAGKIAVAGWAFRQANRRRLLSPRAIGKYFLFWVAVTICFVATASALCRGTAFSQPLVVLGAALLVPLARVGLAPLALASGRHR